MATAMSLLADRWQDIVLLAGVKSNQDGDLAEDFTLPPTLGDIAIMELLLRGDTIATRVANPELLGVMTFILNGSNIGDIVGVTRWSATGLLAVATYVSPDPLVLWRQNETLRVTCQEVDTNASPTVDFSLYVKAVRVPTPVPARPQRIQLVR